MKHVYKCVKDWGLQLQSQDVILIITFQFHFNSNQIFMWLYCYVAPYYFLPEMFLNREVLETGGENTKKMYRKQFKTVTCIMYK